MHADAKAKAGAAMHPDNSELWEQEQRTYKVVMITARYLARVCLKVSKAGGDSTPDRRVKFKVRKKRECTRTLHSHDTTMLGSRAICWQCGQSASSADILARRKCALVSTANKHVYWVLGQECSAVNPLCFCAKCGCSTRHRVRRLGLPCRGAPTSDTLRANLRHYKRGHLRFSHGGASHWCPVGPPAPCPNRAAVERYIPAAPPDTYMFACDPAGDMERFIATPGVLGEDVGV